MTSSNLIPFSFEGESVRVIKQDNEPWWVLSDVCSILDVVNPTRAASRLDDNEVAVHSMKGQKTGRGGAQSYTIINESGLWSLVLTSRKPEAKRFKKWLTSEVIPAIRQTGGYMVAAPEETPEQLAMRAMAVLQATVDRQKAELETAMPKAQAFDELADLSGEHNIRDSAKQCGWPERRFIQKLMELKWLYASPITGRKCAYSDKIKAGYMSVKNVQIHHNSGEIEGVAQPVITQKGLARLKVILGPFPINENVKSSGKKEGKA